MWELDYKENWALKNRCFWTVVLEKTLESPLDCKEIQPVHPKGGQSWMFIGRTDVEAETPIFWPPDGKSWLIWKDFDAEKESICSSGDVSLIPALGRSSGEGKGYPHQYSCLGNSMYCIVHGVAKSWTWLSDLTDLNWNGWVLIKSSLCILDNSPLSDMFYKYVLPVHVIILTVSLGEQKVFILMKSILTFLFMMFLALHLKTHCQTQCYLEFLVCYKTSSSFVLYI